MQFGWLTIIAEPLFYLCAGCINRFRITGGPSSSDRRPQHGAAAVEIPAAESSQKMQKVAPEVRTIQDRYKKYSMRDPRKAKMKEEVMAVYSREGINPLGGACPGVQIPIWYGLYRMLTVTIELRHAPWIGWIHDLSARDPYYILPILMAMTCISQEDDSHSYPPTRRSSA